ncbi:hypothetical protein [Streptomyces olivaceus]
MSLSRYRNPVAVSRIRVQRTEAVLVEQYGSLVRLAYLVLPATIGRHRRLLMAHTLVQRSLAKVPGAAWRRPRVPAPREAAEGAADCLRGELRVVVLRAALDVAEGRSGWLRRRTALLGSPLPIVVGLRLLPLSGGPEDPTTGRHLARVTPAGRAAFVLRYLDGLPEDLVVGVLRAASAGNPAEALCRAARLWDDVGATVACDVAPARPGEWDACTVRAQPTDLLHRRLRTRLAGAALLAGLAAVTALVVVDTDTTRPEPVRRQTSVSASQQVHRTPPGAWADTSRVDFTAWPARGERRSDAELVQRAVAAWARPTGSPARVSTAPGTASDPLSGSPQLLYAGEVEGRTVVVLYDGRRLARYTEPSRQERGAAALSLARVDDADVTTAAAITVSRSGASARYLLAPWIAEAGSRDLLRPDEAARDLNVSADGVTERVPGVPAGSSCDRRPVLQLRSSPRIVEDHSFLLADLGGLSPAHLTHTPLPGSHTPAARQPREATGGAALTAWSRTACRLGDRGQSAIRAVNLWDFAEQRLPGGGGSAVWSCSRSVTWRGGSDVAVVLRTRNGGATVLAARESDSAACSRFGQHVVAQAHWRSPRGDWYILAAGSRAVRGLDVTGDVTARTRGRTLAEPAPRTAETLVTGRLASGDTLPAIPPPRAHPDQS